ncbi:MAG: hypothetical protein U1E93_12175 [Alphaproteobacteria bacterium]
MRFAATTLATMLLCGTAQAAHQDWTVRHQPDRFVDRIMMEAWADADKGAARMQLYCDTESGFRVMFMPHRDLMPEGSAKLVMTIDNARPLELEGDAFGDDTTDVVTVHNTDRIQKALSTAHHVSVRYVGIRGASGEDAFTFGDLSAERATLMKVCPVR